MAEPTVSAILADLAAAIKAECETHFGPVATARVAPAPPEKMWAALGCYLRYTGVSYLAGQFLAMPHTVTATVTVSRKSDYATEYVTVSDAAQAVRRALMVKSLVSGELVAGGLTLIDLTQTEATQVGVDSAYFMAATVTASYEFKSDATLAV
jgi:hypothetical protein